MPSKSPKQRRLMAAAAHNPEFAKKVDVPQSVAREFVEADKREGKTMKGRDKNEQHKNSIPKYKSGGAVKGGKKSGSAIDGVAKRGHTKGRCV